MPRNTNRKKKNTNRNKRNNRSKLFKGRSRNQQSQLNTQAPRRATHTQQEDVIDYLSEDDELNNQRYGCISFATITDDMKDEYHQQIADQLQKPLEDVKEIITEWCKRENPKRAVKVRGVYKSLDQSYRRAEEIRNYDANFHIFTCEVGKWLPFDPDPELLEDENYMESQLNDLLKGYKQNKLKNKMHYAQRKREMMERAIEEGTPEGQQLLAQADKPIEAVKFEAEQADETIEQLQERIKALERTKHVALKTLELRKDELEALPPAEDEKIVADMTVENIDTDTVDTVEDSSMLSEATIQQLERDGIRRGLDQMRVIQDESRKIEMSEFAQEMSRRNPPQLVDTPQSPTNPNNPTNPTNPNNTQSNSRDPKTHAMFGDNVIIPSQMRENESSQSTQKDE